MIATTSNPSLFEFKPIRGFPSSFYPNFVQNIHLSKQSDLKNFIEIGFPNFDYKFKTRVIKQNLTSKKFEQTLELTKDIFVNLQIIGELKKKPENRFYIDDFSLSLNVKSSRPLSNFIATSFEVMRGLSKITFSRFGSKFNGYFQQSLNDLSYFLQYRQLAYRLMVIEKALKISFSIPNREIYREEIDYISYCYHSIIDRNFEFQANSNHIIGENETKHITGELFGNKVDLGTQKASIIKKGISKFESITTPTLPQNAFNREIQKLIDLETKINDAFFDKYLNSTSNAFEELSDEQIEVLTERPTLEEEAFNF